MGGHTDASGTEDKRLPACDAQAGGARPALVVGALTMASRVLGLFRDAILAAFFFGESLDAFALAFTIPNLFRRLFGEGALASVLVPTLVEKIDSGDRQGAARLAGRAFWAVFVGLGALALAVSAASLVPAIALGPSALSKTAKFAGVLAIVMPYVALICGAAVVMAFLNAHRRFGAPAAAPLLLNVTLIAAAFLTRSAWGLAVGVLVGGLLQLLVQLVPAVRIGFPVRPRLDVADPDLRRIGALMLPTVFGLGVFQINALLDRLIAWTFCDQGGVGSLFLGNRLIQLPLAVFAISIATVALPELASGEARGDPARFRAKLRDALTPMLFWTAPAAVGLALLAEPIVALLFGYGSFNASRGYLPRTSLVVIMYAPGLVAFGAAGLVARAFYARKDPGPVVRASLVSVGVNLALNLVLVFVFRHVRLWPTVDMAIASPEAGLALASTASGLVYLTMLGAQLDARTGAVALRRGLAASGASLAAGAAAALATGFVLEGETAQGAWQWLWRVPTLPATVCVGALVSLAVALRAVDRGLTAPLARIAATAAGMGVWTNLLLSSLPPDGDTWLVPAQRALAPVVLGAAGYWFLAGLIAAPEYERARGHFRLSRRSK